MPSLNLDDEIANIVARRQQQEPRKQDADPTKVGDLDSAIASIVAKRQGQPVDVEGTWSKLNAGTFQRSLDADTVDLSRGKLRQTTRLAGIDAPESGQSLGPAAQAYLDQLIGDKRDIRVGSKTKDFYGRDVSILYAGDKNLNVELVRAGQAKMAYQQGLSKKIQEELESAQEEAKRAGRGIWAEGYVDESPDEYRKRVGRSNMAVGHDKRAPIDLDTKTLDEAMREIIGRRGSILQSEHMEGGSKVSNRDPRIKSSERYQNEEGWLDHVTGALDYAGNVSRSGIKGMIEGGLDKAGTYALQAVKKDRYTSSTNLRDTATQKMGLGKLRFGKDDGEFQVGDIGDFAADLITDMVTDPLTVLSAGASKLAKGGTALAKMAPGAHAAMTEAKAELNTARAAKYLKAKTGIQAGIGAIYGVGATDGDEGLGTKLLAGTAGAVLGANLGKGSEQAAKFLKEKFNKASDRYAVATRGVKFKDFSATRDVALSSFDKRRNIAEWIRQGRFEALKELKDPVDRIRTAELMQQFKTEFLRRRNMAEQALAGMKEGSPQYNRAMTRLNRQITTDMERNFVPTVLANEKSEIVNAVRAWGNHNDDVIKKLNREAFGIGSGTPALRGANTDKGIVGIRWHIDDVYEKKNFQQAQQALNQSKIFKAKSEIRSKSAMEIAIKDYAKQTGKKISLQDAENLVKNKDGVFSETLSNAMDKTYGAYTEKFAGKFLSDFEKKASDFMLEYGQTAAKQRGVRWLETALNAFDKVTNFGKANMLYFSMSWLKNNYFDNLAKSYIENGLHGIVDAASFGKLRKGVFEDVKDLYLNRMQRVYHNADLQDALHRGVLDNPMFKSLGDKSTRAFLYTPEQIAAAGKKTPLGYLQRASEIWLANPYMRAVGNIGSHMEGTARMMTYIRVKEALLKSPVFAKAGPKELATVKDIAANIVKKTFFDYGDVTHFENAVFKRMIPFYSFYSKNLPYWIKAVYDPEKVGKVLALEKARRNVGKDPSSYDKQGMSEYLLANGARKLGTGKHGETRYGILPSGSMYDAFRMLNPLDAPAQVVEKGHAVPKLAYELASGRDLFDGSSVWPSHSDKNRKFLFSRGYKWKIPAALTGGKIDIPGVEVDDDGNPYATSDTVVLLDKVLSTLWPHGAVEQVAGTAGKVHSGKETLGEGLINRLSPMQMVKVSEGYARMMREQRKGNTRGKKNGS